MAGVDVSKYIDLTLADTDPTTLVQNAVAGAQVTFPDWIPREGSTELTLLEQMAVMVDEDGYAINRVPGVVTEVLLRLYGLTRNPGTAPVVTVQFAVYGGASVTIPAGTQVVLPLPGGVDPVTFSTDTPLVVAANASSGTVTATGTTVGSTANGTGAGTALTLLTAVPFVDSAVTASIVTSGTDPEDDAAFLDRGAPRFTRLTDTLVKVEHFEAAAVETAGVARAVAYDNTSPHADFSAGADPGHVTVAVAGAGGAPLAQSDLDALTASLEAAAYVLITVHVVNATVTSVNVTTTVKAAPGWSAADVTTNVQAALAAYLDPNTWESGATVYYNELIALVDGVIGVDRVVSITTPTGDLALSGYGPLARVGTITVNVQ